MFEWPQNPEDPLYMQALFVKRWAEQGCIEGSSLRENCREQLCELLKIGQVLINWLMPRCGAVNTAQSLLPSKMSKDLYVSKSNP